MEKFAALEQLGAAFREDERCVAFVDYCSLKAQGLRRPALVRLDAFLDTFAAWSDAERREWAARLMELEFVDADLDLLIAHPLKTALIDLFKGWALAERSDAAPCRWLGVLTRKRKYFKLAVRRDPEDEYSRWRAARYLIGDADYACHHFPDFFIGEPAEVIAALTEAEAFLAPIADRPWAQTAVDDLKRHRRMVDDWCGFEASGCDSFDAWCREQRGYTWGHSMCFPWLR